MIWCWERQEVIRETFPLFEIVILCSEDLLLDFGIAFARSLGAITHHQTLEKTKQPRDWGQPGNGTPNSSQAAQQWTKARLGPWWVWGGGQENWGIIRKT